MTQPKNETTALIIALGLTAAVLGGGFWLLKSSGILGDSSESTPVAQSSKTNQSTNDAPTALPSNTPAERSNDPFATSADVPSGEFRYGGSTTWATLRGGVDPAIESAYPNFKLTYVNASGSDDGIQKLINGELDFAQSSRPLNSKETREAQSRGLTLEEIPVVREAVAIAVHPELGVSGLTLDQLKGIYTGQITNWNQVGGPNLAIVPSSRKSGGTVQFFEEDVLDGDAFTPAIKDLSTTTEALRFVSENPGAIYFASAPEIVGQCTVVPLPIGTSAQQFVPPYKQPYVAPADCPIRRNQLNLQAIENQTYPLTRLLYVIVKKDGQAAEQAGTAYAALLQTQDGKALVDQAGFVPLK